MKSKKEMNVIKQAVDNYNSSPWNFDEIDYKIFLESKKSVKEILENIRRKDIWNFHTEEARCGMI